MTLARISLVVPLVVACELDTSEIGDGPRPCGDGVVAPDELCDDGNVISGDGCSPSCIPSGTHVECAPVLEGQWQNDVNALLPLADGSFMVAGASVGEAGRRGWIGRYDGEGERLWFRRVTPTSEDYGSIVGLAHDGQGGSWALAHDGLMGELMHFDASGETDRTINVSGKDSGVFGVSPYLHAIEYDADRLWIAGTSQGDLWLGRYNLRSSRASTLLFEDHFGYNDEIRALHRSGQEIAAVATVSTGFSNYEEYETVATTQIVLIRFDLRGNEIGRTTLDADPDAPFTRVAERVVSDGQGQWFVGGTLLSLDPTSPGHSWVGRVEPAPAWAWSSHNVIGERGGVEFGDIALVDGAVVLAAGAYVRTNGHGAAVGEGWLANFGLADGKVGWRQTNTVEGYQHYEARQLAVGADGRVRVIGKAWTPNGGSLLESCVVAW